MTYDKSNDEEFNEGVAFIKGWAEGEEERTGKPFIARHTLDDGYQRRLALYEAAGVDGRTNRKEFRSWILRCLSDLGGRSDPQQVVDCIEQRVGDRLTPFDRSEDGSRVRWVHDVHGERNEMRKEGLIASGSPHGIWELTANGRAEVEKLECCCNPQC